MIPSFDELRRANPTLRFAVYALEPSLVTLEIVDENDQSFLFNALTLDQAIQQAFPEYDVKPETTPEPAPEPSIFD